MLDKWLRGYADLIEVGSKLLSITCEGDELFDKDFEGDWLDRDEHWRVRVLADGTAITYCVND